MCEIETYSYPEIEGTIVGSILVLFIFGSIPFFFLWRAVFRKNTFYSNKIRTQVLVIMSIWVLLIIFWASAMFVDSLESARICIVVGNPHSKEAKIEICNQTFTVEPKQWCAFSIETNLPKIALKGIVADTTIFDTSVVSGTYMATLGGNLVARATAYFYSKPLLDQQTGLFQSKFLLRPGVLYLDSLVDLDIEAHFRRLESNSREHKGKYFRLEYLSQSEYLLQQELEALLIDAKQIEDD